MNSPWGITEWPNVSRRGPEVMVPILFYVFYDFPEPPRPKVSRESLLSVAYYLYQHLPELLRCRGHVYWPCVPLLRVALKMKTRSRGGKVDESGGATSRHPQAAGWMMMSTVTTWDHSLLPPFFSGDDTMFAQYLFFHHLLLIFARYTWPPLPSTPHGACFSWFFLFLWYSTLLRSANQTYRYQPDNNQHRRDDWWEKR